MTGHNGDGNPVAVRLDAEEKVLRAALAVLSSERHLADEKVPMRGLKKAQDRLAQAARELAEAVDKMPVNKQPRNWTTP